MARPALAELDATTGVVDTAFRSPFRGGQVNDLELVEVGGVKHPVVAGSPSRKVMSLHRATGRDDGWITVAMTEQLPGSWGTTSALRLAVDPSRTHLAVTGNFMRVAGQARSRSFMLDLTAASTSLSLSSWFYPGFAKSCASEAPRRIAYLKGPDGSSLSVAPPGRSPTG